MLLGSPLKQTGEAQSPLQIIGDSILLYNLLRCQDFFFSKSVVYSTEYRYTFPPPH